ncbi:MAG: phenylacetate--CoA ligase family protein [Spirochaetota bacterium]
MDSVSIPESLLERVPLFKKEWLDTYLKLKEHPAAPHWNTECGDRLLKEDQKFVESFSEQLQQRAPQLKYPDKKILSKIEQLLPQTPLLRKNVGDLDLTKDFFSISTMSREDLSLHLEGIVPLDVDLQRLVVNDTSGTTGHAIHVPNHPSAIGCYDPMIEFCLDRYIELPAKSEVEVVCILLCYQRNTITYSTVHSYWQGAGYAKINLHASEWNRQEDKETYIKEMSPLFLAGDPISFSEYLNAGISYAPKAFLSTAVSMTPTLRDRLEEQFSCPVIDFYSLNDTGPIAYSCPHYRDSFHILPTDIFVEILDEEGNSLPEGEVGEITITGGRNPYVPLLRYRTGDFAALNLQPCSCGELTPKLENLQGRKLVLFEGSKQTIVNPIDISKILRKYPITQHQFVQQKNGNCELSLRTLDGGTMDSEPLQQELGELFGASISITFKFQQDLGTEQKVIPFVKE